MLLTVDIGNTNITLGLFNDDRYENEFRLPSDRDLSQNEYEVLFKTLLKDFNIDGCIISSVVDELNEKIRHAIDFAFSLKSMFLTYDMKTGVKIAAEHPEEMGADRIANAAAVVNKYNSPIIVVDFGTATTFDIINSNGEFFGGIIAPGLKTQLKSLSNSTSKLPQIEVSMSNIAIGRNTEEAILSGVVRGSACMVDGLIEQCEKELGEKAVIIATGGFCGLVSNYMKHKFDSINPILTLEGLRVIYNLNKISV